MSTESAMIFRDCAHGLLRTARRYKAMQRPNETKRLVGNARFYWRRYIWAIIQENHHAAQDNPRL